MFGTKHPQRTTEAPKAPEPEGVRVLPTCGPLKHYHSGSLLKRLSDNAVVNIASMSSYKNPGFTESCCAFTRTEDASSTSQVTLKHVEEACTVGAGDMEGALTFRSHFSTEKELVGPLGGLAEVETPGGEQVVGCGKGLSFAPWFGPYPLGNQLGTA